MGKIVNVVKFFGLCIILVFGLFNELVADSGDVFWQANGIPVAAGDADIEQYKLIPAGSGNTIIVWKETGVNGSIYAKKINSRGQAVWNQDVRVFLEDLAWSSPIAVSDGNGGAIIACVNFEIDGSVYLQRINSNGEKPWGDNAVVCGSTNELISMDSDGNGGAVFALKVEGVPGDFQNSNGDIYAQKINADGTLQWGNDVLPVCIDIGNQVEPKIVSDNNGGAIVCWNDERNMDPVWRNVDIYAQKINADGIPQWGMDGIPVCHAENVQQNTDIISDGTGGAIICWEDWRDFNNTGSDIYIQRINMDGNAIWLGNGVPVCTANSHQQFPKAILDSYGFPIIIWDDRRALGGEDDIYLQRININTGATLWINNGTPICTADGVQQFANIISNGNGGAMVSWEDGRPNGDGIYVQAIDVLGNTLWARNGISICNAPDWQRNPKIISDNNGGAVIAWVDYRTGDHNNGDIYAQRVDGAPQNLGFELGNFIKWTLPPGVNLVNYQVLGLGNFTGINPSEGRFAGFISNSGKPVGQEAVLKSQWLRIPENATHINYRWNILTNEVPGVNNPRNDTVIVRKEIEGGATITAAIMRVNDMFLVANNNRFSRKTGWKNSSSLVTADRGKRVRFHFAIKNIGDANTESAVLLDDLRINYAR
jgi:hypothetical protein